MWHDTLYNLSPVHNVGGMWFKRDDLYSPDGIHNGSKFRQLIWLFNRKQYPGVVSGAVTGSPQLSMVASCAQHYGMGCVQFTGAVKNMAVAGERLGATTILVNPGYAPLLNKKAKEYADEHGWLHIETNITESVDVEKFHRVGSRQVENLPKHIETLMIPAGSRNSVCSILYGLWRNPLPNLKEIILFSIAPSLAKREQWMNERMKKIADQMLMANELAPFSEMPWRIKTYDLIDAGYTSYNKLRPFNYYGIDFHPRYEGKVWCYIRDNPKEFQPYINDKTLFWIVGSEPKSPTGYLVSATKPVVKVA